MEWTQADSPLSAENQDMNPTNIQLLPSGTPYHFKGLSKSYSSNTLFNGMGGLRGEWAGRWWYSVGYRTPYNSAGNPAVPNETATGGYGASKTELFVFIPRK